MIVKTKFDIGQKVWMIKSYYQTRTHLINKWVVLPHKPIVDGEIRMSTDRGQYWSEGEAGAWEEDIFTTRKAAQAECDRRNKEKP